MLDFMVGSNLLILCLPRADLFYMIYNFLLCSYFQEENSEKMLYYEIIFLRILQNFVFQHFSIKMSVYCKVCGRIYTKVSPSAGAE